MRRMPRMLYAAGASFRQQPSTPEAKHMDAASLGRTLRGMLSEGNLAEEAWQKYAARASELSGELSVTESARLASCFAMARFQDFDLFARLSSSVMNRLDVERSVTALDVRRLAVAFGRVRAFDSELMHLLVPHVVDNIQDFRPRELVQVADAYARMPVQSPDLFALVAEALPSYLYELSPGELSSLCRAFAEAAVYNDELTDALCGEVVKRLRSFGAFECLVFLDGLSQIHVGLPVELTRADGDTVAAVADHLATTLGSLGAKDLVKLFRALVRLSYYDQRLIHTRLCSAIAQKLGQLDGPRNFTDLAELLHCLSLLPDQSHKSMDLALSAADAMRHLRSPRVEPRAVALAVAALAQLDHRDEDLLGYLGSMVAPVSDGVQKITKDPHGSASELLALASDEELDVLGQAFALSDCEALEVAQLAVDDEKVRRGSGSTLSR